MLTAAVATAAVLLTACTGSSDPGGKSKAATATPSAAATQAGFTGAGEGFGVEPATAAALGARATDVSKDPAAVAGLPEWKRVAPVLEVDVKAQPTKATTISVPLTAPVGRNDMVVVLARHTSADPWEPLKATVSADGRHAVAATTHFSTFAALLAPVQEMLKQLRAIVDEALSGAPSEGQPPTCEGTEWVNYYGPSVRESGKKALSWCVGLDPLQQVKVVNMRRYPLLVRQTGSYTKAVSQDWFVKLVTKYAPGYKNAVLLLPREGATFAALPSATVRSEFDGLAESLLAFTAAYDAAAFVMPKSVPKVSVKHWTLIKDAVESTRCLNALSSGNPARTIATCMTGKVLQLAYGDWGEVASWMLTGVAVMEFFHSSLNALGDQFNDRSVTTLSMHGWAFDDDDDDATVIKAIKLGMAMLNMSTQSGSAGMRALSGPIANPLADELDRNMEPVTKHQNCAIFTPGPLACDVQLWIGPPSESNPAKNYRFVFKKAGDGSVSFSRIIDLGS
ncbi:hypothetical protein [Pedococcus sp. 2YAF34]|uniref:hypothetical protein n=1 Tax=Pedococcus sp. 2YAF34 TaxID=3233032 RepID=UPI003F9DA08E